MLNRQEVTIKTKRRRIIEPGQGQRAVVDVRRVDHAA